MTDPKPPAWLRPINKVLVAMQKLGIVAGPVRVLTVPGRNSGGLVKQGTADEFEALAGRCAVFRLDTISPA